MWTLGIDIAKQKHNASLLDDNGQVVFRNLTFTNDQKGLDKLLRRLSLTGKSPAEILVGMEATGNYWMLIFQHLEEQGLEVLLINPIVTHARRNITIRGSKTDPLDSMLIALILRETGLKTCVPPDNEISELRTLTRLRFELMQEAVALKQKLLSLLQVTFPEYRKCFSDIFGKSSQALLGQFPTAEQIAQADIRRLTKLLSQASRGRLGRAKAEEVKRAAQQSFARIQANRNFAFQIRILIEELNLTLKHIEELDKEMSKRGSKYLRTALMEAAQVAVYKSKDPMFVQVFEKQIARNKSHWVALSHVANKMCQVIFSILKNQKPYEPHPLGCK